MKAEQLRAERWYERRDRVDVRAVEGNEDGV
jgi:hypothetical protein